MPETSAQACALIGRTTSAEVLSGLEALTVGAADMPLINTLPMPGGGGGGEASVGSNAAGATHRLRSEQRLRQQAHAESTEVAIYRIQQGRLDKLPSGIQIEPAYICPKCSKIS